VLPGSLIFMIEKIIFEFTVTAHVQRTRADEMRPFSILAPCVIEFLNSAGTFRRFSCG